MSDRSHGMVGPPVAWKSRFACLDGSLVRLLSRSFKGGRVLDVGGPLVYLTVVKRSLVDRVAR